MLRNFTPDTDLKNSAPLAGGFIIRTSHAARARRCAPAPPGGVQGTKGLRYKRVACRVSVTPVTGSLGATLQCLKPLKPHCVVNI